MIFPLHRFDIVSVVGAFVERNTSFNLCTMFLLEFAFTLLYKNQYSFIIAFLHAFLK